MGVDAFEFPFVVGHGFGGGVAVGRDSFFGCG